ncbi:MAG: DnaA ATPase domain-containing protein, partial [Gammaproteobacteria bacterium]
MDVTWQRCSSFLRDEMPPQQFNTWIRPLRAQESADALELIAPNRFVKDWVHDKYIERIRQIVREVSGGRIANVQLQSVTGEESATPVSSAKQAPAAPRRAVPAVAAPAPSVQRKSEGDSGLRQQHYLVENYTFQNFVEGKSNQLARAAAQQVAENPGGAYNPLFIYGGVGLGKTHLMHAVGNSLLGRQHNARVVYLHSERFVADMVKALQLNQINDFKRYYRSVDALLIDDIQFFAGKERSQEEFFHTFNALLEGQQQVILTCDR